MGTPNSSQSKGQYLSTDLLEIHFIFASVTSFLMSTVVHLLPHHLQPLFLRPKTTRFYLQSCNEVDLYQFSRGPLLHLQILQSVCACFFTHRYIIAILAMKGVGF